MSSNDSAFPTTLQLVDKVPLIKSPSFWVSKPVELPPDIHPLPEDVHAYFVYPHTIESHALSVLPAALEELRHKHEARCRTLTSYAESKERARKARLNQIAPGWSEGGSIMQPSKKDPALARAVQPEHSNDSATGTTQQDSGAREQRAEPGQQPHAQHDPLSDFVAGLENLDSSLGSSRAGSKPSSAQDDLI
ncbi:hypothetical protein OIO90_001584 [Microbotryomycetes sp. JL221]|nr:hypothetical protein OIO90_001584 [Microbotryomycetes sp. JL221]